MTPDAFLDTCVLLRHVLADHETHSPAASQLITQIERGELAVRITDTVVFDTVFILEKTYRIPRERIVASVLPIMEMSHVVLPGKNAFGEVFALWTQTPRLSFADCFHVVFAKRHNLAEIISFDQGLSGIEGVTRREPPLT